MHLSAMVCKLNKYLKFTGKWAKSGTSSLALADLAKNVLLKAVSVSIKAVENSMSDT